MFIVCKGIILDRTLLLFNCQNFVFICFLILGGFCKFYHLIVKRSENTEEFNNSYSYAQLDFVLFSLFYDILHLKYPLTLKVACGENKKLTSDEAGSLNSYSGSFYIMHLAINSSATSAFAQIEQNRSNMTVEFTKLH